MWCSGGMWSPPIELSPREVRICTRLQKRRRFFRFVRLHRHELVDQAMQAQLASLYSDKPRGTPPHCPAQLLLAVLLQAYCKCSDSDVIELLLHDSRWQMCLDCFDLEDPPFSQTTFVDFRARLIQHDFHLPLLRKTVELCKASGDFGYKQAAAFQIALDSAPLQGAGKVEDTLNLLGRALGLLVLVVAASLGMDGSQVIQQSGLTVLNGTSVKAALDLDWNEPGAQDVALRTLTDQVDRFEQWQRTHGTATAHLDAVKEAQTLVHTVQQQNTERDAQGQVRMRQGVAADRLISISDPQMRHGRKSKTIRINGYKKYLAQDVENRLIVAGCVLPANAPEASGADTMQQQIESYGTVGTLLIDRAFVSSQLTQAVERNGNRVVCRAYHPIEDGLYTKRDFTVDVQAGTVRCPGGKLAVIQGEKVKFSNPTCRACPQRKQCQKPDAAQGRTISISPQEGLLQKLAKREKTTEGRAELRQRVGIEHALAHHCRRQGPVARYRGVAKNTFDVVRIAAVQNLLELDRRTRAA